MLTDPVRRQTYDDTGMSEEGDEAREARERREAERGAGEAFRTWVRDARETERKAYWATWSSSSARRARVAAATGEGATAAGAEGDDGARAVARLLDEADALLAAETTPRFTNATAVREWQRLTRARLRGVWASERPLGSCAVVGSSAMSRSGSFAKAMAIMTRWR